MTEEEIDLLEYLRVLAKNKNLIIALVCVAVILTSAISLVLPYSYKAETTILIPEKQGGGSLMQLMSGASTILPLDITSSLLGRTTSFTDILESRSVSERVVELLDLQKVFPKYKQKWRLEKALMKKMLKVENDKKGNLIILSIETKNPALSAAIANAYLLALDEYNQKSNLYVAKRTASFVLEQLASSKFDLNIAEDKLKDFEVESKMVQIADKELRMMRLLRDVKIKEEIYKLLSAEYEKSIFDERKDTQFFEVLDPAKIPKEKDKPKVKTNILIAAISSLFFAVFLAFFFEYLEGLGIKVPKIDDLEIFGGSHGRKHSR